MAEQKSKPQVIKKDDTEALEAAAQAAAEEPKGYFTREQYRKDRDNLEQELERMTAQILSGQVDFSKVAMDPDIASKTQFLSVSNAQPGFVYGWISKNRHGQHLQAAKLDGWEVVQGDDPEAIELKGTHSGVGSPDTTRQLGDVILVRISRDRYLYLKAQERARTMQMQYASNAGLLDLASQSKVQGKIKVHPYRMGDDIRGPELKPRRLTTQHQALGMLEEHLRAGTVPGMEMTQ